MREEPFDVRVLRHAVPPIYSYSLRDAIVFLLDERKRLVSRIEALESGSPIPVQEASE